MKMTFRWYGPTDPVTLENIRQIPGMTGVVTALYTIPVGKTWDLDSILNLKKQINDSGLEMEVIESVPVHEEIKLGSEKRDELINNYIETITFYPSYEGNMVSDAKTDDNVINSSVQVTFNNGSMRQAVLINPIEVVDIKETENVISRDDAYGIFKDNIINVMDLDDLTDEYGVGDYESVIYVNGIEKELVLTEKEDGVLEYVPAWIFVGGMDVTKNDVPYRMIDESAQTPLLIISAVDGRMLKVEK